MFCVDVRNLIKLKGALYHHYRMQPSEIENFEYWEFELTLEDLQENLKERKDQEKRGSDDQQKNMPNMNKYTKGMGGFKMPNIKMPK